MNCLNGMLNMKQVDSGHYDFSSYDSKKRFVSYWHQIKEILELEPENVLEVGIGNKTVTTQLRKSGINVITLDVDKELSPMIVGDVRKIPIKSNEFDVVGCFEVLEHLPFKHFLPSLSDMVDELNSKLTKNNNT